MLKDIIFHVLIYAGLFTLIVVSILDAPVFPQDAFSIILITWMFYETMNQKFQIIKLREDIKRMKEVMEGWTDSSSHQQ